MLDTFNEGLATVLAWLYDLTHSYGLSIILLTLAVRVLVTPLTIKGTRSMMAMQAFQPEIKRLQQEFKGDRQRLNEEMLKFYKENNINPMGSCLPLLIQLPVFFILYNVIRGLTDKGSDGLFDPKYVADDTALHESLSKVDQMLFLGVDLARSAADTLRDDIVQAIPYLAIIAIVTATSYIQQKQVSGRNPDAMSNPMQKNLMRVMPLMFAVFSFSFPAALGIYFVTSNLWQVAQQWYISRHLYGMRKGVRPAAAADVITVQEVKKDAGGPKAAKPTTTPAKGGAKSQAKGPAKPRTSGRVTEPKRGQPARPGSRPAPGRRTAKPQANGESGTGRRRRIPFGSDEANGTPPGDAKPEDPKKRRS